MYIQVRDFLIGPGNLIIDQSEVIGICVAAAVRVCTAESAGKTIEHVIGAKGIGSAEPGSHGDFIGSTVAVQIAAVTEGLQAVNPFINSGGYLFADFIQPGFVDQQRAACKNEAVHFFYVGETIGVSVGSGNFRPVIFTVIKDFLQVGHIFVDKAFGRHEDILIRILNNDVAGFAVAEAPEYIGKLFTGSEHQIDFFLCAFGRDGLPFEFDTGIFKPYLAHFQILYRNDSVCGVYNQSGNFAVFGFKGFRILDDGKGAVQADKACVHGFLFLLRQAAVFG